MPYKDPNDPRIKAKRKEVNATKQAKHRARERALAIIEQGGQVKENLQSYLFQMGLSIKKGDARQMWLNYLKYKEVCTITNEPTMPLTVFMVLGLAPEEVKAILEGRLFANDPEVRDCLRKIMAFVLADIEQAHLDGDISNTTLIWYQKNFAGMSDFPEQKPIEVQDTDTITPEQIADKYKNILD